MILSEYLTKSAHRYRDKIAIKFGDQTYTYDELDRITDDLSSNMERIGIRGGDRVVVMTGNKPETVISLFTASKMGAIFVPVNPQIKQEKLKTIIDKCDPKCIMADDLNRDMVNDSVKGSDRQIIIGLGDGLIDKEITNEYHIFADLCKSPDNLREMKSPNERDVALIMFTSGSTGEPKGVTLSHANIDAASNSIIEYLNNDENDVILNAIPLSFDYGLYQAIMSIKSGGTLILEKSFTFFNQLLERIQKERVTGFPIVPSMAEILLRLGDITNYDLSSLRYITNTAQALSPKTIEKLIQMFPGVSIYSMYGLTECKRVSFLDPSKIMEKPTSVGKAIPNTDVILLDDDRKPIHEPGKIGELAVKGPHIMIGYWNDTIETERTIIKDDITGERILLTGDLFRFDEEGDLYFVGRKDQVIKIGGEKATPQEVEAVITSMDGISSCVVIPIADYILGNRFICFAQSLKEVKEDDILRFCSERLEKYMIPKRVYFIDHMPLTANGKIDRESIKNNKDMYMKE
ncbi:MAG: class I adenylate-forming enzyme family protein [Candidatus Thermoplasmatota archaeon]|nr:class I adenylate-forming enzyme family protein [Candidatus Thermoplasmatota archaeon]